SQLAVVTDERVGQPVVAHSHDRDSSFFLCQRPLSPLHSPPRSCTRSGTCSSRARATRRPRPRSHSSSPRSRSRRRRSSCGAYTLLDKHGVQHAGPLPYVELVLLGPAIVYSAGVTKVKGLAAVRAEIGPATIAAGIATLGAYTLVLAALQRASAASVAAVRET